MNRIFPKLYEKSSTGKTKHWEISVNSVAEQASQNTAKYTSSAMITVNYGVGDSKIRKSEKLITTGKNIGKSNETSAYDQALLEAESTWKQKLDKGYVQNVTDLNKEVLLPMLAQRFQERKHDIIYPAYVQPKLDGVRCLAKKIDNETMKYYSRMGKEYTTLEHLTSDLLKVLEVGQVLDGEIYSHDYTFQEMISFVKKLRPESPNLEYYVFDSVPSSKIKVEQLLKDKFDLKAHGLKPFVFEERYKSLVEIFQLISKKSKIRLLKTEKIQTEDDVYSKHNEYVKAGYEGIIIRNITGLYSLKKRSKDLQKYKEFKDEEFIITGGVSSTGTETDCIIFNVKNKKDQEFAVRPRGSFEQRKQWLKNIDKLIGKKLIVRFQEKTDAGLPRFPVGIAIRDFE